MDKRHFDELIQLENTYWWHVAKRQLAVDLLQTYFPPPGRLVEAGIGSARNLLAFQELGYHVTGLDIAPEAVDRGHQCGLHDIRQHDVCSPWPIEGESSRVAVMLDVLEHVADPVQVLRYAAATLEPGGGLVITVPAYPQLYGDWDRRLGHVRRYTRRQFRSQAAEAGLSVVWTGHWNAFTLPAALVSRGLDRLLRRDRPPLFPRVTPSVNRLLLGCARVERWFLYRVGIPFGLSIVGVLKK